MNPELRRPPGSLYHMNQYQHGVSNPLSNFFDYGLDGGPIAAPDTADWELDVETTGWGANATHWNVDDLIQVRNAIVTRLQQRVSR